MNTMRGGRAAFVVLIVVGALTLLGTLHRLPARIATHFDGSGLDGSGSS